MGKALGAIREAGAVAFAFLRGPHRPTVFGALAGVAFTLSGWTVSATIGLAVLGLWFVVTDWRFSEAGGTNE